MIAETLLAKFLCFTTPLDGRKMGFNLELAMCFIDKGKYFSFTFANDKYCWMYLETY